MPSWIGDAVMATPALRLIRELLPGAFIGGLVRPGIDALMDGLPFFDDLHVDRPVGVMGPKRVAARLRPRRYQLALLLTNSFSTALITRIAGIPERIGYDRDGRGFLLTDRLTPKRRRDVQPYARSTTNPAAWAPVPAVDYYHALAGHMLRSLGLDPSQGSEADGPLGPLELVATHDDRLAASQVLERCGLEIERQHRTPIAVLNPGGNNPAKRWPVERFAALGDYLAQHHGLTIAIAGGPNERELAGAIAGLCGPETRTLNLPEGGLDIPALKGILQRARVLVTNDTGPRHIAAAFGTPVVTLFGPTDHRWTTIPHLDEVRILADPELPAHEVANDHPERVRIDRIGLGDVVGAANRLLASGAGLGDPPRPAVKESR
ncbi:MAG: glycosyltransferase family 9 protein [Phycisphaerales bacterium]